MPSHNYTPIPLEDEHFSHSYNTGIPSTAPPSFQTVATPSNPILPQRNPNSAAPTLTHPSFPPDDPALSIWAPSSHDLEAAREDTIAALIARVEALERRNGEGGLDEDGEKGIAEGNGAEEWSCGGWKLGDILTMALLMSILVWVCALVTVKVLR